MSAVVKYATYLDTGSFNENNYSSSMPSATFAFHVLAARALRDGIKESRASAPFAAADRGLSEFAAS